MVAFRLAAGVAIPLKTVCDGLCTCSDGIVTVDPDKVSKEFHIPMSGQTLAAQEMFASRSLLILASVPYEDAK